MTPIFQTRYEPGRGNCLTACVASLLDVPLESLPEFCDAQGAEWFDRLYDYATRNGLFLLYWTHKEDAPIIALNAYVILEMSLEGVTGENHAVVGRTYRKGTYLAKDGSKCWEWATEIVHDPNQIWHPPLQEVKGYLMIGKTG